MPLSPRPRPCRCHRCDQCGYRYRTERTKLADLLQSERTVWLVSLLLLVAVAVAGSLLPGAAAPAAPAATFTSVTSDATIQLTNRRLRHQVGRSGFSLRCSSASTG